MNQSLWLQKKEVFSLFSWSKKIKYFIEGSRLLERHWNDHQRRQNQKVVLYEMTGCLTSSEKKVLFPLQSSSDLGSIKFFNNLSLATLLNWLIPWEEQYHRTLDEHDLLVETFDKNAPGQESASFSFLLDNCRSAYNVGSFFRVADCLGARRIYLCGFTPSPKHRDVSKTAMGADEFVDWEHNVSTHDLILTLKRQKKYIVAIETVKGASCLYETSFSSENLVFVFGNERYGLSQQTLLLCDQVVRVPVFGRKNSLNVGICASVVGYEMRRRSFKRHA